MLLNQQSNCGTDLPVMDTLGAVQDPVEQAWIAARLLAPGPLCLRQQSQVLNIVALPLDPGLGGTDAASTGAAAVRARG